MEGIPHKFDNLFYYAINSLKKRNSRGKGKHKRFNEEKTMALMTPAQFEESL